MTYPRSERHRFGDMSAYKKASQSSRPQTRKVGIIFSRDLCVRENISQAASVEFVRLRRTNYARSRLQALCRKIPKEFSTVSYIPEAKGIASGMFFYQL